MCAPPPTPRRALLQQEERTFEHRYDSVKTTIRVTITSIPGESNHWQISDYRRKRDFDTKWSTTVKEEVGRTGTLAELTPGRRTTQDTTNDA